MSCQKCEEQQEPENGEVRLAYYRWKNANIEMVGCNEHLREIFDVLSKVQKEQREEDIDKP